VRKAREKIKKITYKRPKSKEREECRAAQGECDIIL